MTIRLRLTIRFGDDSIEDDDSTEAVIDDEDDSTEEDDLIKGVGDDIDVDNDNVDASELQVGIIEDLWIGEEQ
ncbi:hypothetical protein EAF00_000016 [Botryotinia globosa]|nr:hypothetical protein EAF00_000016 [Botryotinia globosa]